MNRKYYIDEFNKLKNRKLSLDYYRVKEQTSYKDIINKQKYSEYIAENLDKQIKYSEYIAENLDFINNPTKKLNKNYQDMKKK